MTPISAGMRTTRIIPDNKYDNISNIYFDLKAVQ